MSLRLLNKVAIVTGAGRGIGKAIAIALAEEGADVVVNYSKSSEAANLVVSQITALGRKAIACQADVSVAPQVEAMVKTTQEQFGTVHILVNNAGITRDKLILRMSEEDWDAVLDTNLKGAFLCSKAVAPILLKQKSGVIVNVGSVNGLVGSAGQANYSASKAGLMGLTKALAKEFGKRGVRVNAVAPGFIETEMTEIITPELRETVLKQIPLGIFGKPEDVGKVVSFLCSPDAAYVNGVIISIDGGLFM